MRPTVEQVGRFEGGGSSHFLTSSLPHLSPSPLYTLGVPFAPEYVTHVLNENFEDAKILFAAPLLAIHHAHLVMLASQRIAWRP